MNPFQHYCLQKGASVVLMPWWAILKRAGYEPALSAAPGSKPVTLAQQPQSLEPLNQMMKKQQQAAAQQAAATTATSSAAAKV